MNDNVDLFGHVITTPAVKERIRRPLKIKPFPSRELTLADTVGFTIRDGRDVIAAHVRPAGGQFETWVGSDLLGSYSTLDEAENAARLAISSSEPKSRRERRR
jgi:hypothetical protein